MRQIGPYVVETLPDQFSAPPGVPRACTERIRERSRTEWHIGDGQDPAHLLEDFLDDNGLAVRNVAGTIGNGHDRGGLICGAAVFISAAAGAVMVGAPSGRPTPVPALPDLVAVVYEHTDHPRTRRRPVHTTLTVAPWRESWTRAEHAAAVSAVRAAIARGDVYQVNVVGHAAAAYTGDPRPALARLGRLPGARYGGVLTGAGWAVGCASPETLVTVADGRVLTRPIKGTRPATARGRDELLTSAKERAEHVMIVDLERNDLGRVARTGSVRVDELYAIRRWADLWQAESTVSAALDDGCGLADLLRAVCPGGSVTGAPKLAALAEIAAVEPVGRGAGMGGLGWVDAGGALDLGLTIRTAAADADHLHVWAGGGITWSSEPWAEVAEAAAKAAPVRAALTR